MTETSDGKQKTYIFSRGCHLV